VQFPFGLKRNVAKKIKPNERTLPIEKEKGRNWREEK
jgi:hypothetical protein